MSKLQVVLLFKLVCWSRRELPCELMQVFCVKRISMVLWQCPCYPYGYSSNVWKAFCELWGPLTNTFHQGSGEMSISLYDLKVIGGLPILGTPYEEFLPSNYDLCKKEAYSSILSELLRIHSQLCVFYGQKQIFLNQWLDHFYRGKVIFAGYGEKNQRMSPNEQKILKAQKILLEVTKEGALAAFLVFWLCRFVLPLKGGRVRPKTFPMACLMAHGSKVSLAPTVLGYIYHGLGEIVFLSEETRIHIYFHARSLYCWLVRGAFSIFIPISS